MVVAPAFDLEYGAVFTGGCSRRGHYDCAFAIVGACFRLFGAFGAGAYSLRVTPVVVGKDAGG